jgi:hypothetical protein
LNLYSTDWGGTDTNLTANLPAKTPKPQNPKTPKYNL